MAIAVDLRRKATKQTNKICTLVHVNIIYLLACVTAFSMDECLLSIIAAGCGRLVKMFITLEPHGTCIFGFIWLNISSPVFS